MARKAPGTKKRSVAPVSREPAVTRSSSSGQRATSGRCVASVQETPVTTMAPATVTATATAAAPTVTAATPTATAVTPTATAATPTATAVTPTATAATPMATAVAPTATAVTPTATAATPTATIPGRSFYDIIDNLPPDAAAEVIGMRGAYSTWFVYI